MEPSGEPSEPATTAPVAAVESESDTQYFRRFLSEVLLQELATGRYYQAPSLWCSNPACAEKFPTASAARACATQLGLTNVQVVTVHEFRECELLPLQNKLLRVWPAQGPSKTQFCPKGLLIAYSEAGEATLIKSWHGKSEPSVALD